MMQKALFPGYTVGPDAYEDIVNICSAYGKKAAIIGGRKALAAAEPQIRKAVEGSGIEITGTFWYGGEASRENMDMLRPQVADADMIFAVGGGKAIDTCKVLAHETNRPFFTFPTIASTCASCTSLGIVYHPDGSLREYSFSKIPPNHIFINTEIIANAPARYLWAGMGDTMAKHYECTISSRNDVPAHSDAMGIALSSMCAAPILRWGKQAMADCEAHRVTPELTEIGSYRGFTMFLSVENFGSDFILHRLCLQLRSGGLHHRHGPRHVQRLHDPALHRGIPPSPR